MPELVPVRVRDCVHPDSPHADGDFVYLRPTLSLEGGIAATQDYQTVLGSGSDVKEMSDLLTRRWLITFVRYGVDSTNFGATVDDVLADYSIAERVADKANDLYYEAVLRPLGLSPRATSPRGQTAGSTSATKRSTRKSPASS